MNAQKFNEILRKFGWIKHDFSSNTKRKKKLLFLYLYCFGPKPKFEKMDQKFPFGDLIEYGNSCMENFFANSKIFRFHAILYDADGSESLLLIWDLVIVMFYLGFQVLVFLVI